ncbi:MAG: tannase/feruloyl esterase family alpha/beta hydrolase [Gammaproteobacteria bacterium]
MKPFFLLALTTTTLLGLPGLSKAQTAADADALACQALLETRNLTLTSARLRTTRDGESHCYVRGIIYPAIHYHVQLPLPHNWNGRFLQWGDGGKDGDLDFADHRVAEGYAVANSNTGHDTGTEPGSSFGFNNRQSEIDFGHRAVHLTVMAGKTLVDAYYNRRPQYSYFEGCSTGGRQGLMEAQRYPNDFDGIVAGAPVNFYQAMNAAGVWHLQQMFKNDMAGNLAVDTTGDGRRDSTRLVDILNEAVLGKCDAIDGVQDGVIDSPFSCNFDPVTDLADRACPAGVSTDSCFTGDQIQTISDFYRGAADSEGKVIYPGKMLGSEPDWVQLFIPGAHNNNLPGMLSGPAGDHVNYLFFEQDPGVAIPVLNAIDYQPRKTGMNPEYHWMEFSVDEFTAGKASVMSAIMDATDPDLGSFLRDNDGKLIVYHGLTDALSVAEATVSYFSEMVDVTFDGSFEAAAENARLFLAPGMGHCGGGPGPNTWDKLPALVDWVENGIAPDSIIATHRSDGRVDNERPLCPVPQRARYTGPVGGENDPANWTADNFTCQ